MQRAPVKSAARVLEIFEFFNERRGPLTLKEITERLGYPQSSTTVLLKSLIVLGYLNYDRKGRTYLPSLKLASIGGWIADHVGPRGPILDLMSELRERTGETIALAVQNDIYVQYLKIIDSDHLIRLLTAALDTSRQTRRQTRYFVRCNRHFRPVCLDVSGHA
jgi:DNA-binding IclR family transcriptional regulator